MKIKTDFLITFGLLFSMLSTIMARYYNTFNYVDEAVSVIAFIFIFGTFVFKQNYYDKFSRMMFFVITLLIIIGLLSNLTSIYNFNKVAVIQDVLMSLRPLLAIEFCYIISRQYTITYISEKLYKFSCVTITILFLIGLYSQLRETTFALSERRYGLYPFKFVFSFPADLGFVVLILLSLLLVATKKNTLIYVGILIIGSCTILFTTKVQVFIFPILLLFCYLLWKFRLKINIFTIVIMGIALFFVGLLQINDYFMDLAHYSPRRILLLGAFDLANKNFPFGTGFSSYASEMANRYYSPIYIEKGFHNLYALDLQAAREGGALNDSFVSMVIGQFGWIGTVVFYFPFVIIIKRAKENFDYKKFSIVFSIVVTYIIASIGSGTIKANTGILGLAFLGILMAQTKKIEGKYK